MDTTQPAGPPSAGSTPEAVPRSSPPDTAFPSIPTRSTPAGTCGTGAASSWRRPPAPGKTVVGEFAVWSAVHSARKCFYTTPIKALSNQKYHDLVERYGADRVGLLTGDSSVNGEAQIVVMTTEVLRNMIYAGSHTLANLGYVVMDEVHYLADRFRGAVWEEVIIGLARRRAARLPVGDREQRRGVRRMARRGAR